jgi:hypothetical protein
MNFKKNLLITESLETGMEPFRNAIEFLFLNIVSSGLRRLNVEP